jgi:hypothetical protein
LDVGENPLPDVYGTTGQFIAWLRENDGKQPAIREKPRKRSLRSPKLKIRHSACR